MFKLLLLATGCLFLAWGASYYVDFIARDPYNFDKGPTWYGKLLAMLLLLAPFLLVLTHAHRAQPLLFNALLSLAISSLVVPAIFANRTGEGGTWLLNVVEKSIATAVLAPIISYLTVAVPLLWWFAVLVALGAFSVWSRHLVLFLGVQDETKPAAWNDMRVRAMRTFIHRASLGYWLLALGLGALVHQSGVGVSTWNKGMWLLWQAALTAIRSRWI